jgi:hypothetical protein
MIGWIKQRAENTTRDTRYVIHIVNFLYRGRNRNPNIYFGSTLGGTISSCPQVLKLLQDLLGIPLGTLQRNLTVNARTRTSLIEAL